MEEKKKKRSQTIPLWKFELDGSASFYFYYVKSFIDSTQSR